MAGGICCCISHIGTNERWELWRYRAIGFQGAPLTKVKITKQSQYLHELLFSQASNRPVIENNENVLLTIVTRRLVTSRAEHCWNANEMLVRKQFWNRMVKCGTTEISSFAIYPRLVFQALHFDDGDSCHELIGFQRNPRRCWPRRLLSLRRRSWASISPCSRVVGQSR